MRICGVYDNDYDFTPDSYAHTTGYGDTDVIWVYFGFRAVMKKGAEPLPQLRAVPLSKCSLFSRHWI